MGAFSSPIILSVGRLVEKKGLRYLIESFPLVLKKYPRASLVIAGEGPEQHALLKLTRDLGIQDNVFFVGRVENKDLPAYYSMADVYVLPSIVTPQGDTEGLGVVLLEALACGTPVIGSNVGGIPDIISHRKTGLLVEQKNSQQLADALRTLLSNRTLRLRVTREGKNMVTQRFSWKTVEKQFVELFNSL